VIVQQQRDNSYGCVQTVELNQGTIGSIYYENSNPESILRTPGTNENKIPNDNANIQTSLQKEKLEIASVITTPDNKTKITIKGGS